MNKQALLELIKANEQAKKIDIDTWASPCQTYGCLYGNYAIRKYGSLNPLITYKEPAKEFGISKNLAMLIFGSWYLDKNKYGLLIRNKSVSFHHGKHKYLSHEKHLKRLRKIVYYLLRKDEFVYDKRGVREEVRQTSPEFLAKEYVEEI